jgi:hypothetical protein
MKLCVKWTFLAYGNDLQHSLGQKKGENFAELWQVLL